MRFVSHELVAASLAIDLNAKVVTSLTNNLQVVVKDPLVQDFKNICQKIEKNNPQFWKNIVNDSLMYAACKKFGMDDSEVESILEDPRRPRFIE